MFIQNVSMVDVTSAYHYDPGPNSMLIQIVDPDMNWPEPKFQFAEVLRLKFLDIEEESVLAPQKAHARQIVEALMYAKQKHMNVIVHCVAGISRSGAVAEAGVIMGFQDTETHRIPNLRLKKLLLEEIVNVHSQEV